MTGRHSERTITKDIKESYAKVYEYWLFLIFISIVILHNFSLLHIHFYCIFILSMSSENEYPQLMLEGLPISPLLLLLLLKNPFSSCLSICVKLQAAAAMFCSIFGANGSQPLMTWAKQVIVMTPFCYTIFICQQDPKWQFLPQHGCCCSQSLQGRDKCRNFITYSTHGSKHGKSFSWPKEYWKLAALRMPVSKGHQQKHTSALSAINCIPRQGN